MHKLITAADAHAVNLNISKACYLYNRYHMQLQKNILRKKIGRYLLSHHIKMQQINHRIRLIGIYSTAETMN